MRIVDLFCGIGGVAEAARQIVVPTGGYPPRVFAAVDIDSQIADVYEANHGVRPRCHALESIREVPPADLLWLSPPCQPYTSRGRQRAEADPRSASLANVIRCIERAPPPMLVLENVVGFRGSVHHRELAAMLQRGGYAIDDHVICPTRWGVPMRRERYYLRASRRHDVLKPLRSESPPRPLAEYLDGDADEDTDLWVASATVRRFGEAMRIVDASRRRAIASCFTSAYGKSPVRAGSYLSIPRASRVRRFSPAEIAALMGFRDDFWWGDATTPRDQYRWLGNSLAVPVVRALLESMIGSAHDPV